MTRDAIRTLMQEYLGLLETGRGSAEANERALIKILDRLALAVHEAPPGEVTDESEAPRLDYESTYAQAAARFPNYGLYGASRLLGPGEGDELLVGDAIDDITDIAIDMHEAAWAWDHIGQDEGLWTLRFGFESHWGLHLRELQAYLHLEQQERRLTD